MIRFDAYTATTEAAKKDDLGQIFLTLWALGISSSGRKGLPHFFRSHGFS